MDRYDRGWMRGYGRDYRRGYGREHTPLRGGRYGGEYREEGRGRGMWGFWPGPAFAAGYGAPSPGRARGWMGGRRPRWEYDRGLYGRAYPGPVAMGYDRGYGGRGFIPESEYREHPELDRTRRPMGGRWPERGYTSLYGDVDDEEIRSTVQQNLQQDGWVNADSIQVSVDDQVVTLTGDVGDYLEARYAWDDAWETMGVRGVINNLTVHLDETTRKHQEVFPQAETGEGKKAPARKAKGKKK